ncbi:hypothetical protein ACFYKX_04790 [Cytobacillus sp. FJAT-54145]|uniref:DUF4340 domain-containing protein n=1 Tax=Cytobacillus spartinae TaxID=3299023 RepID=A0ABW6K8J8_9BACI
MKRKYLLLAVGILTVIITMIVLDIQKVKREEKPPLPSVSVGKTNVPAVYQSFNWHNGNNEDNKIDPPKTIVEPYNDLVVKFPDEEKPDEVFIEKVNILPDIIPSLDPTVKDSRLKLPVHPVTLLLSIHAKWENKGEATYLVEVEIEEKTSYQRWLSPSKEGYGVFIIESESDEPYSTQIPPHAAQKIMMMGSIGGRTLEKVQVEYPELNLSSLPTYVVLDDEKILLNTNNKQEFDAFFDAQLGSAYEYLIPEAENMISTLSIVDDYDFIRKIHEKVSPFYRESSPMYRITHVHHESEGIQKYYPELEISKTPVFFVLNHKGVVYKTHTFEDFIAYLEGVFDK